MQPIATPPICSIQSAGFGIRAELQQYKCGIFSRSSTDAPDIIEIGSSLSSKIRNRLMTSPSLWDKEVIS
jgi:hypothetical protein